MTAEKAGQFIANNAIPNGYLYTLVMVSITKRALAMKIPSEFRMEFLEHLEKLTGRDGYPWITPDMIAAVEPLCDKAEELVREARPLGPKALDAYAKFFPAFAALNPSLIAVLEMVPGIRPAGAMASA